MFFQFKDKDNIRGPLVKFAIPYLAGCFLQTFYGMVDLMVVGLYNGSSATSAVAIGSQVMHMATVVVAGLAMGITVMVGQAYGAKEAKRMSEAVSTGMIAFMVFGLIMTAAMLCAVNGIVNIMLTPAEAVEEAIAYLRICFWGVPFIFLYNICASAFRGVGDSKRPLVFVAVAAVVNIVLDFALVGGLGMGAAGAAMATVAGQIFAAFTALVFLLKSKAGIAFKLAKPNLARLKSMLAVGIPIAFQDGMIQVAFLVITVIANSRGLTASSAVGIVEKIIGFLFLVPSAFLASLSAITAQNMGAGKPERARKSLAYSLQITIIYGFIIGVYCQFLPGTLIGIFTRDAAVYAAGCAYLRSYAWDTMFAGVHFCFSGYFCGDQKSIVSFIHNMASILILRVPGAYLSSVLFPDSLYPMGWAAPAGSLLSGLICVGVYIYFQKKERVA